MGIAHFGLMARLSVKTAAVGALFLPLSVLVYARELGDWAQFVIGVLACLCFISIAVVFGAVWSRSSAFVRCANWTMPVFLMHTIFAAGLRVVLLKLGIASAALHIVLGLIVGFVGPVLAMLIMERLKPLDFLVYPNRYIKLGRSNG